MAEAWAPGLSDVGACIPTRTRDKSKPGQDKLLNTFNATTTPTDVMVQQRIDDAVSSLIAQVGELLATAAESPEIADLARAAVAWRVAADVEIAYPNRDADVRVYDQLNARAQLAFQALSTALQQAAGGGYTPDVLPQWSMPVPVPWGDLSPGSGVDYLTNTGNTPGLVI
jgi:hypothetical protein